MLQFPIDPEYCLILNAFSRANSLRGAAALLGMDPPSLVRKVRRLTHQNQYLIKVGNRWELSATGRRIAQWTEGIINEQTVLKEERASIRIGSFAWLAEEMLIPQFEALDSKSAGQNAWTFAMVAKDLEKELIQSRVDFVVTGHAPTDPSIHHKKISTHPWVAIIPRAWKDKIPAKDRANPGPRLKTLPYIRHAEINPEQYLDFKPESTFHCVVDGVVGVRSAVASGYGWSIVPAMSIQSLLRQQAVLKFDVQAKLKDEFCLWWLRDRKDLSDESKQVIEWLRGLSVT